MPIIVSMQGDCQKCALVLEREGVRYRGLIDYIKLGPVLLRDDCGLLA